jgi:hypothetical protein
LKANKNRAVVQSFVVFLDKYTNVLGIFRCKMMKLFILGWGVSKLCQMSVKQNLRSEQLYGINELLAVAMSMTCTMGSNNF